MPGPMPSLVASKPINRVLSAIRGACLATAKSVGHSATSWWSGSWRPKSNPPGPRSFQHQLDRPQRGTCLYEKQQKSQALRHGNYRTMIVGRQPQQRRHKEFQFRDHSIVLQRSAQWWAVTSWIANVLLLWFHCEKGGFVVFQTLAEGLKVGMGGHDSLCEILRPFAIFPLSSTL
jgi:hypothetical protein